MTLKNFQSCLDMIYGPDPLDLDQLNQIYTQTAPSPLGLFDKGKSVGFKMRFREYNFSAIPSLNSFVSRLPYGGTINTKLNSLLFRKMIFDLFKKHQVVVFLAIRQDNLRWGLSKYRGDGFGGKGHIQFKLAKGAISKDDLPMIHVDPAQFQKFVKRCEYEHQRKLKLMNDLKKAGVDVYPLCYEDFVADKQQYFQRFFKYLDIEITEDEINQAIEKGAFFKKVNSDDISEFVENHEEIEAQFGKCFVSWQEYL